MFPAKAFFITFNMILVHGKNLQKSKIPQNPLVLSFTIIKNMDSNTLFVVPKIILDWLVMFAWCFQQNIGISTLYVLFVKGKYFAENKKTSNSFTCGRHQHYKYGWKYLLIPKIAWTIRQHLEGVKAWAARSANSSSQSSQEARCSSEKRSLQLLQWGERPGDWTWKAKGHHGTLGRGCSGMMVRRGTLVTLLVYR